MSNNIRTTILRQTKEMLHNYGCWEQYQTEFIPLCLDLPEQVTYNNQKETVLTLKRVKEFLSSTGLFNKELDYISEEIFNIDSIKQFSIHAAKETTITAKDIDNFVKVGYGTEGVIGIPNTYNYEQTRFLTNEIWNKTKLVKFYISNEKILVGNIVAEIYDTHQSIPVASVLESTKRNSETEETDIKIKLFGDYHNTKSWRVIKEIESQFYVYKYLASTGEEMILLTQDKQEIGEKIVTGITTKTNDLKQLTDSAKIGTKLTYLFAQEVESKIARFNNNEEFKEYMYRKNMDLLHLSMYPFSFNDKKSGKMCQYAYPEWYENLIWAWLLHENIGRENPYPMHLMIMGEPGTGKSTILNQLQAKSQEVQQMFSGVSSTLKSLVPSFRTSPPQPGYLACGNRFSFCDEFFRCVLRDTNSSGAGDDRTEQLGILNDLLEHQKRKAGSGNGSVTVNMKSRVIGTSNPVRGSKDMNGLLESFDSSFLSRWLILFQTPDMIDLVRDTDEFDLVEYKSKITNAEFLTIIDYLQTVSIDYDKSRLKEIYEMPIPLLSGEVLKQYSSRHKHHIQALFDGFVKYKCIMRRDFTFTANDKDYELMKEMWHKIITSWFTEIDFRKVPIYERYKYMPEPAQRIYDAMKKSKKSLDRKGVAALVKNEIEFHDVYKYLMVLCNAELVIEDYNNFEVYKNEQLI